MVVMLCISQPEDEDAQGEDGDEQGEDQFSAVLVEDEAQHGQQQANQRQNGPQRPQYLVLFRFRLCVGRRIRLHKRHLPG